LRQSYRSLSAALAEPPEPVGAGETGDAVEDKAAVAVGPGRAALPADTEIESRVAS
jgi:hypothetical protein